MAQATGLGGVFLRAGDPEALYAWYEKHLGLPKGEGCFALPAEKQRASIAQGNRVEVWQPPQGG